jgi:AraC-like DNA-binding protein
MLRTSGEEADERLPTLEAFVDKQGSPLPGAGGMPALDGLIRGGLPPWIVQRTRAFIDANIDQRITVDLLARLANLSVSYFVRAFKRSVGVTPHEYLMRRRVELAVQLLSETDLPLSEVAHAAGFGDQSHCARRLRQYVGMTPRAYRRSMQPVALAPGRQLAALVE